MLYRVYGHDAISKEARAPLAIEADSEAAARQQAAEAGIEVLHVELPQPPAEKAKAAWPVSASILAVVALAALALFTVIGLVLYRRDLGPKQDLSPNQILRRSQYADQMKLAREAWEAGRLQSAEELLEALQPPPGEADLRGFEWYYLKRMCHPELVSIPGLAQVVFSQKGRHLAGVHDNEIQVWDLHECQTIGTFAIPGDAVASLSLSADGTRLAAVGASPVRDGERPAAVVKVWEVATGKELLSADRQGGSELVIALSPDGTRLVEESPPPPDNIAEGAAVTVRDVRTGQKLFALPDVGNERVSRVVFSLDGTRLATVAGKDRIQLWDAADGKALRTLPGGGAVAFSAEGLRHRVAGESEGDMVVWDVAGGNPVAHLKGAAPHPLRALAFTSDGQRLATAGPDGQVVVWDVAKRESAKSKPLFAMKGYPQPVTNLAFVGDGRRLVTASEDKIIRGWDATSSPEFAWLKCDETTWGQHCVYAWSGDGQRLAIAETSGVFSLSSRGENGFPFNTNWGKRVAVWDLSMDRKVVDLFPASKRRECLAMSRDGLQIAVATDDHRIHVLDGRGRELFTLAGHTATISELAFAPEGQQLASASEDHTVRLWDLKTGKEAAPLSGHTGPVGAVAFSAEGQRLISVAHGAGGSAELKVWDSRTGRVLSSRKGPPIDEKKRPAISPDGRWIASIGGERGSGN